MSASEVSDNEPSQPHQGSDEYDVEDSFINDNSMLTQVSPSQREGVKSISHKSVSSGPGNMYLQSLMSPEDRLFGGRRRRVGGNNQYRMVFSQRHQILNHYIKKAGFNVADSARKGSRRTRRKKQEHDSESDQEGSHSEAEEVNFHYGDEDCVELSQSQCLADVADCSSSKSSGKSSSCASLDCQLVEDKTPAVATRKRRPGFLSDSDLDATLPLGDQVISTNVSKRLRLSSSPTKEKGTVNTPTSSAAEAIVKQSTSSKTPSTINRVIISPSLLVSLFYVYTQCLMIKVELLQAGVTIKKTAPCFSLGMDDWLSDIDNMLVGDGRGEDPTNYLEEVELGVASEGLLLSQEEVYQLEGFQDSDTELL